MDVSGSKPVLRTTIFLSVVCQLDIVTKIGFIPAIGRWFSAMRGSVVVAVFDIR